MAVWMRRRQAQLAIDDGDIDLGAGIKLTPKLEQNLKYIFPKAAEVDIYPEEDGGGLILFKPDGTIAWTKPRWEPKLQ